MWNAHKPVARRQKERLIALLIAGVLALSFPQLSLFIRFSLLFGIPLLYFYLFSVWALIIVASFLIVRSRRAGSVGSSGAQGSDT
ncbi:MAG: hypothetical protein OEW04_10075 [Nitrospirota bacterium]|nr:hypothetical protein [Nitrospirota bacterium]